MSPQSRFPPTVHCSWSCARHAVFAHRAGLTLQNLMTQGGVVREHKTGVLQDNKQEYRDESSWSLWVELGASQNEKLQFYVDLLQTMLAGLPPWNRSRFYHFRGHSWNGTEELVLVGKATEGYSSCSWINFTASANVDMQACHVILFFFGFPI